MREFEGAALIARRRYPRFVMRPTDRSLPCCSELVCLLWRSGTGLLGLGRLGLVTRLHASTIKVLCKR